MSHHHSRYPLSAVAISHTLNFAMAVVIVVQMLCCWLTLRKSIFFQNHFFNASDRPYLIKSERKSGNSFCAMHEEVGDRYPLRTGAWRREESQNGQEKIRAYSF
jgi:hypothetical protein